MLLTRNEEVKIILTKLKEERLGLSKTLNNMRAWATMSGTNLGEYEPFLGVKADLQILDKKIKNYEESL